MNLPGVPAGQHIVRGAILGAAAGAVLALFTRDGASITLGVLVGVVLVLLRAWIRGELTEDGRSNRRRVPKVHRPSDEKLARRDRARERAAARRRELVEQARAMDVLNAVFALTRFNRRHAGPGPVDLHDALGDLYDAAAIDEAIKRTDALIFHAADSGFGAQDARDDRAELQLAHPGFSLEHLSEVLNWGYYNGR